MKTTFILIVILLLFGTLPVFAQQGPDMSFYISEYNRSDATIFDMLDILRMVKDEQLTGIGDFYQNAIRVYIQRLPNFSNNRFRLAIEEAARLILQGLAAEKHTAAAPQIWFFIQYFDISQPPNDGFLMYEALVAMGKVGGKDYTQYIIDILEGYNARPTTDIEVKGRVERVMAGIISALEDLCDPSGVKPVFFASIGWYDTEIKKLASVSLIRTMEALGDVISDVISEIILDHFNLPPVKIAAWEELLRAHVSNSAKSKVATSAIEASYTFVATSRESQNTLRFMRMSAIDTIRVVGVEDDRVYPFLERTYREAFDTPNTDFEVIVTVVRALSGVKTEEAVDLLIEFLRGLHSRKRSGPWGVVERDIMAIVIPAIGSTGTQSRSAIQLLTVISTSSVYTNAEQNWARNALAVLRK